MGPFLFMKLRMSSGFSSTETSFATGLPRLVIRTDSPFRLNFVHHCQTMGFECTSRHLFHEKHPFRSWSLHHSHNVEKIKRPIAQSITKKYQFPKTNAISITSASTPHKTFSAQTKGFLCKVWLSIRHHEELSSGELKQVYAIHPAPLAGVSTLRASTSKPVACNFRSPCNQPGVD